MTTKDYPDGVIAIYDNGGKTADRYTVAYEPYTYYDVKVWPYRGMSERPTHSQGFGQYGENPTRLVARGHRIAFADLPEECRALVLRDEAVKRYVDGFGKAIDAGEIGLPDNQDRHVMGLSHIDDHINEGYYVPSLLYRACQAKRYGNPELVYQMITERRDGKWGKQVLRWYLNKFYIPQAIADAEQRA